MLYQLLRQVLITCERDLVALGETGYNAYLDQARRTGECRNALRERGVVYSESDFIRSSICPIC